MIPAIFRHSWPNKVYISIFGRALIVNLQKHWKNNQDEPSNWGCSWELGCLKGFEGSEDLLQNKTAVLTTSYLRWRWCIFTHVLCTESVLLATTAHSASWLPETNWIGWGISLFNHFFSPWHSSLTTFPTQKQHFKIWTEITGEFQWEQIQSQYNRKYICTLATWPPLKSNI